MSVVEQVASDLNHHQPHPGPDGSWACLGCPVVVPTWAGFAEHLAPVAVAAREARGVDMFDAVIADLEIVRDSAVSADRDAAAERVAAAIRGSTAIRDREIVDRTAEALVGVGRSLLAVSIPDRVRRLVAVRTAARDLLDAVDHLGVDANPEHDGTPRWEGYRQAERQTYAALGITADAVRLALAGERKPLDPREYPAPTATEVERAREEVNARGSVGYAIGGWPEAFLAELRIPVTP